MEQAAFPPLRIAPAGLPTRRVPIIPKYPPKYPENGLKIARHVSGVRPTRGVYSLRDGSLAPPGEHSGTGLACREEKAS
jgi:hypothetical protein